MLPASLRKLFSFDRDSTSGRILASLHWRQWAMLTLGVICFGIKSYEALPALF